jgi:hypothetical protein
MYSCALIASLLVNFFNELFNTRLDGNSYRPAEADTLTDFSVT